MNFVKLIGLIFLLTSCTVFGFYKSGCLIERNRNLTEICIALEKLFHLVKNGTGELEKLIKFCFGDLINIDNGIFTVKDTFLLNEDTELLYKLLKEMGISDREKEYKRILLYKSLFLKQQTQAESNVEKFCKLYNSCGFLVGLSLCIFLI